MKGGACIAGYVWVHHEGRGVYCRLRVSTSVREGCVLQVTCEYISKGGVCIARYV